MHTDQIISIHRKVSSQAWMVICSILCSQLPWSFKAAIHNIHGGLFFFVNNCFATNLDPTSSWWVRSSPPSSFAPFLSSDDRYLPTGAAGPTPILISHFSTRGREEWEWKRVLGAMRTVRTKQGARMVEGVVLGRKKGGGVNRKRLRDKNWGWWWGAGGWVPACNDDCWYHYKLWCHRLSKEILKTFSCPQNFLCDKKINFQCKL